VSNFLDAASLGAMRWSTYLHPDSVFLAQNENVMIYGTPRGIAVLEFSGDDVTSTTYPGVRAFTDAMKVKDPGLVMRAVRSLATLQSDLET
jgi:hypothetical protein